MRTQRLKIDYNSDKCELCELGRIYDTDKSSQRDNITHIRHSHPYTLFYDSLFKHKKNETLEIAELGILKGSSLRMWNDYFKNSKIYGFDNNFNFINGFKENYGNDRIVLSHIDVKNKDNIKKIFSDLNVKYDIIIEDTTHQFEDQINIIENVYQYLKPGGIMIIEDIFKSYNENDYIERLKPILHHFQDYYFVELDHVNRNSTGWNNDKLFILIKGGEEYIFKNKNKMTIITPSYRVNNLVNLKNSINFNYVHEWIIVYDGSKITNNPNLFTDYDKIKEYVHKDLESISGNSQRNYALTKISNTDTYIYYLDDDNIIHPSFYRLMNIIDDGKIYTFNQFNRIKGNNINISKIDTAMFLIYYELCKEVKWIKNLYSADGRYIKECYEKNKDKHIYVDNDLCYYNRL
jgi:predicted O-methyltransferase YrrM